MEDMAVRGDGKNKRFFPGLQGVILGVLSLFLAAGAAAGEEEKYREMRIDMVKGQIESRGVKAPQVLQAMRKVPRHRFVREGLKDHAYEDRPLPIGHGQTISQPYIVAYMSEILEPEPGDVMLEVGTGSGYQAAVLSEMVEKVYTIEIIPDLAESARERIEALGYQNVTVRTGDGYYGWEEYAPFDGIIVTAAATHIPPPLIEQLKPGARMVIPVGPVMQVQQLMLVVKQEDGSIVKYRKMPVRFVPLTGSH